MDLNPSNSSNLEQLALKGLTNNLLLVYFGARAVSVTIAFIFLTIYRSAISCDIVSGSNNTERILMES